VFKKILGKCMEMLLQMIMLFIGGMNSSDIHPGSQEHHSMMLNTLDSNFTAAQKYSLKRSKIN
jgi:hypothetical protein